MSEEDWYDFRGNTRELYVAKGKIKENEFDTNNDMELGISTERVKIRDIQDFAIETNYELNDGERVNKAQIGDKQRDNTTLPHEKW